MRRAPDHWREAGWRASLLEPAAVAFRLGGRLRRVLTTPFEAAVPVLCVGNLVAGGAGKTPVALALAERLIELGRNPHFLTRGYGGALAGPVQVDPARHKSGEVGDEALLLAAVAPSWVAHDRPAGARAAAAAGAGILVMDDGLQNPSLRQDRAILVVDGGYGFGNGRVIPAGPLRETLAEGIARVQAAVVIGPDLHGIGHLLDDRMPVLGARLAAVDAEAWRGRRVIAFAGIGRPQKFFDTLTELGAELVGTQEFPDHHPYGVADIRPLLEAASASGARLVTTAKDRVRLPAGLATEVDVLRVKLAWAGVDDRQAVDRLLAELGS
jgi:tetraacyldisaccharide 4'-kinase